MEHKKTDVLSILMNELRKKGITKRILKSKKDLIPKMAEKIAALIAGTTTRVPQFLRVVQERVVVKTKAFSTLSLFASSNLWMDPNFNNWVKPEISETISTCEMNLSGLELTKDMNDSEIRKEIGTDTITPDEFTAILSDILVKQPNGESGNYNNAGKANIFYVQLKDRVVAVYVHWYSARRRWNVYAWYLGGNRWSAGNRVFSQLTPACR